MIHNFEPVRKSKLRGHSHKDVELPSSLYSGSPTNDPVVHSLFPQRQRYSRPNRPPSTGHGHPSTGHGHRTCPLKQYLYQFRLVVISYSASSTWGSNTCWTLISRPTSRLILITQPRGGTSSSSLSTATGRSEVAKRIS